VRANGNILTVLLKIEGNLDRIAKAVTDAPPSPINANQSYTRGQAARLLSVSTWTIDQARKQGLLAEASRLGERHVRITGESLLRFAQKKQNTKVKVRNL
jgi:hypothetical protein